VSQDQIAESKKSKYCTGLLILCLVGVVLSLLSLDSYIGHVFKLRSGGSFCNISATVNCDAVHTSPYATISTFPIAALGLGFYLSIALFAALVLLEGKLRRYISASAVIADAIFFVSFCSVLYSLFLFYVSKVQIGSLCILCIGMYVVNVGLCLLAWRMRSDEEVIGRLFSGFRALAIWPMRAFWLLSLPGDHDADRLRPGLIIGLLATVVVFILSLTVVPAVVYARLQNQPGVPSMDERIAKAVVAWKEQKAIEICMHTAQPMPR
jgi:uncharacterized membrane protein